MESLARNPDVALNIRTLERCAPCHARFPPCGKPTLCILSRDSFRRFGIARHASQRSPLPCSSCKLSQFCQTWELSGLVSLLVGRSRFDAWHRLCTHRQRRVTSKNARLIAPHCTRKALWRGECQTCKGKQGRDALAGLRSRVPCARQGTMSAG